MNANGKRMLVACEFYICYFFISCLFYLIFGAAGSGG